jgi:hypothetical protein
MSRTFVITFKAKRDDAAIRGLRATLKTAWRTYGLRCIDAIETTNKSPNTNGELECETIQKSP